MTKIFTQLRCEYPHQMLQKCTALHCCLRTRARQYVSPHATPNHNDGLLWDCVANLIAHTCQDYPGARRFIHKIAWNIQKRKYWIVKLENSIRIRSKPVYFVGFLQNNRWTLRSWSVVMIWSDVLRCLITGRRQSARSQRECKRIYCCFWIRCKVFGKCELYTHGHGCCTVVKRHHVRT